MSFVYLISGIVIYILSYKKTRDLMNPMGIFVSIWFVTASIANLHLNEDQHSWCIETHFYIIISGMVCFITSYSCLKKRNTLPIDRCYLNFTFDVSQMYRIISRLTFAICLLTIGSVLIRNRINIFQIIDGIIDKKSITSTYFANVGRLASYIIGLFPYCALLSFFEICYSAKKTGRLYNIIVICITVIYCLFVLYSRGIALVIILGCIFIYNEKNTITFSKMLLIVSALVFFMYIFLSLRLNKGSSVYLGTTNSRIFNSTYNYISYCFDNFDTLVRSESRLRIWGNIGQSFRKLLGIYSSEDVINFVFKENYYNAVVYIGSYFDDLDFLGVLLYPSIISLGLTYLYNYQRKSKYIVLILAAMQKAIFCSFFGDYFLGSLSIMFPYICIGMICFLSARIHIRFVIAHFGKLREKSGMSK